MDRFTNLRIFAAVVESQSFTIAADRLGLSRAVVSKAIGDLERTLGARLLERTTRRVRVNEVGAAYYEKSSRILADLDEADQSVRQLHSEPRGLLRVNAPVSFAVLHLKPVITRYLAFYPQASLSLTLTDRFVDLIDEGVDVAIRIGKLEESSLIARRLASARRVLCASPTYLEEHGIPRTPVDLSRHACLPYSSAAQDGWRLHGPDGEHVVRITGPLASNNGDMLHCAAANGLGIALLPTFIVGPDLQNGTLQIVLPEYVTTELSVYAVYPPTRHLAAKVRTFIDVLAATFGARPYWDLVE
jgi:DNA-binding transcriptional LysR family regulator